MKFSEKLMSLRKSKGMSQENLAEKLNVTRQTISKWELDQTTPDLNKLLEISKLFEISIDELTNKNYMIRQAGERIALNTPIQGTCADILKLAMVRIAKELEAKGLKSKMILQMHDELVFDCLEEEKDTVIKIAKEIMENVIKLNVPLRADASFGTDWYEAK